jgi:UDP-N-acetyl-2-amino-2-deoxyglucuronate dehydrogenase
LSANSPAPAGPCVGVAVVGTGLAGRMHVNGLRLLPQARLAGAVGTSFAKAEAFSRQLGLPRAYRDLDELLADPAVQVVHVCTPPHTHIELVQRLAAAQKHILVDKPIARNVAEADAMIAACDRAGVLLGGLFQHRYIPQALAVKRAITEGRLGELYLADCYVKWWRDDAYYAASSWRARWRTEGGGALINQAIHSLDLLQWLCGPVLRVSGRVATVAHAIETEDLGVALVELAGGRGGGTRPALGVIEGATAAYPGFPERLEIHGTGGSVVLDEGRRRLEWYLRGQPPRIEEEGSPQGNASDPAAVSPEAHAAAFADFLAAVRSGERPAVDGREARRALEVVEAIYRSAAAGGTPVQLPLAPLAQ